MLCKEMTIGITLKNSDPSKCTAAELLKVANTKITRNCYSGGNKTMDVKEAGCENKELIHLAQDRNQFWALVNTMMERCINYSEILRHQNADKKKVPY